jgi:hypothetical protein
VPAHRFAHAWRFLDGSNEEDALIRCSRATAATGQLHWVHNIAVDSRGNIYTTEVDNAKRVQKFAYQGLSPAGE